ncbi:MAG: hypothetical protein ACKODZ_08180, partial [Verrucomicrobiota bacterium]
MAEAATARTIESLQGCPWIPKAIVELGAKFVIDQTHAGIPVAAVSGRSTQVFAEDHGIVAWNLVLEYRISMIVGIAKATRAVELPLDSAKVAGITGIFIGSKSFAKKVVGHVFDGVEAQSVRFGAIHFPAGGADQVAADV